MQLSALERKVLNCIQEDIPLVPEPFKVLAKRLDIKEDAFLRSLKRLKEKGLIQRYAAFVAYRKLCFKSSLIALRVPEQKLESIAKKISGYSEVTHCYLRNGDYNLWTVFLYKDGRLKQFLNQMAKQIGRENILNLPTKRQFKLKTALKL